MARHDPLGNLPLSRRNRRAAGGAFSEVSIAPTITDVIQYPGRQRAGTRRKLPGLTKFGNVTLKRGVTASLELVNWHLQVVRGQIAAARKQVAIVVLDAAVQDLARFVVTDAWPVKYDPGDLNASGKRSLRRAAGTRQRGDRARLIAMTERSEPLSGALFRVEIEGLSGDAALEVVLPESRIVTERDTHIVHYGPLTLRRGLTGSPDWYQWWDQARDPGQRAAPSAGPCRWC